MDIKEMSIIVGLVKDIVLTFGGITTIALGMYGIKIWKRDLVGKEAYAVISKVIKDLHKVSNSCRKFREAVLPHEHRTLSKEELQHLTKNEQWCSLELEVFNNRVDKLVSAMDELDESTLSARVLLGSSVYATTLEFRGVATDCINSVNEYLDLLRDQQLGLGENSPQILIAQQATFVGNELDDTLSIKLIEARESAETALIRYLHRNTIRGNVIGKEKVREALKRWKAQYEERKERQRFLNELSR